MKEAFEEIGLDEPPAGEEFYQYLTRVASIMVNTDEKSNRLRHMMSEPGA